MRLLACRVKHLLIISAFRPEASCVASAMGLATFSSNSLAACSTGSTWWIRDLIYDGDTDPRHARGEQDDMSAVKPHDPIAAAGHTAASAAKSRHWARTRSAGLSSDARSRVSWAWQLQDLNFRTPQSLDNTTGCGCVRY